MEYTIRKMAVPEYPLLSDFLYEAYAAKLYLKIGFEIVRENNEEYIMVNHL